MPFDALGNYIPDDEEPSLDAMQYELSQKKPSTLDIVKAGIQNMPGASFAQGVAPLVNFPFQVAGSALYGLGKQLLGSEPDFNKDTTEAMRALQYEPPTRQGKEFQEAIGTALEASKIPPYIGHMPPARLNANDVRVLAKQNIERAREVGRIPEDFRNAQEGVRRESNLGGETYGSQLQRVAEDVGDVTARRQSMGKSSIAGVPEGMVEVFDPKLYAVRNTGEGQMIRPQPSPAGMEPRNVDFGDTEQLLKDIAPPLSGSKPEQIIEAYEQNYMSSDTPEVRQLNFDWEKFQTNKIKELFPRFSQTDAFRALRAGYPANVIQDMKLKWFHDFVAEAKAKGAPIPTMEEFFGRAQAANTLTKKIIPNIIQKYIGTPNDPFLESAKQGITMNPAEELLRQHSSTTETLRERRRKAGFAEEGEVTDKLLPVAESKLATQTQELDNLIAEQAEIGRAEGMMVPYPDGRIDPETGQVAMATNPNYAQYTNKIGAMRKAIADSEEDIRKLNIAKAYENVSDLAIRMDPAYEWRNRIPVEEQQFHPALFGEKPKETPESPDEFKTPAEAPFFEAPPEALTRAGVIPLTKSLIGKIMSGEIPPNQVPTLSQPHTITKYMADIVAPRIEKEKAARLAQATYKEDVGNHFKEVLNELTNERGDIPVGDNAKLLWLDDGYDSSFIQQALSDETFVLDHCIGQSGNGRGLKNLFTGEDRSYIPYLDPVTGQPFQGASGTSSYMDRIESGDLDIMSIRDDKTGLPVGTIELNKNVDDDGDFTYDIGYVSGYKNRAIDEKYRNALRDALNKVGKVVSSSDGNENKSGVYDMRNRDQLTNLRRQVDNDLPTGPTAKRSEAWTAIQQNINKALGGDRYVTIDQVKDAIKEYKQANPPVPVASSGFPPSGKEALERNIIMQGLSRENLDTRRQLYAAQMVASNNRFAELALATNNMEPRPLAAYRRILNGMQSSEQARGRGNSDYELFRNLQNYVDQINDGTLRFADFNLDGGAELLELRDALQKHADAVGQLAHYADVLQRNGYRSPLPSERTGAPEWQAYQQFIGELNLNDPQDIRTRLRDMIEHGDPREVNANLDALQQANFKHLLEIHDRAIKQAVDHPAPSQVPAPAVTQQQGIPLQEWENLTQNTLAEIDANFGDRTRQEVGRILADAIAYQMDVPVNERPVQVSNYLTSQAREAVNPVAVRNALRVMAGAIDQANADVQNARNAPEQAPAMPTGEDFRNALLASMNDIPASVWADVDPVYERITAEIRNAGDLPHQQPRTVVNRLNEEANFYDGEGEPDTANGLRTLANRIARLVPENPPATMALANQNAVRNQPDRQLVAGQEALSNSIMDAMNDIPALAPTLSDRLNALQWRENLVNDPAGLIRNIRIEADAEDRQDNYRLATQLYSIANLIADENGQTMFTPAERQTPEPRRTPRDIAETASAPAHQSLTQRMQQINQLTEGINEEIRSIPTSEAGLRQAQLFYEDPNNLPASIVDYTHQYDDAERIANFLLQHVNSRLDRLNQPQTQAQMFDNALERVSNEIRNTYTDTYMRQFQNGDVDVRREVLRDVQDRPAVYGMAQVPPNIQTQVIAHLRNEGLPENQAQLPAPAQAEDPFFPNVDQFRNISRQHANEFTGAQDSFYRIGRQLREMNPEERIQHLARLISQTGGRAGENADRRTEFGVDSPAGMNQLNSALRALRTDLEDRNLLRELQQPADNGNNFEQMRQINDAITQRGLMVNREHLGISQRFDDVVRAASAEFNPQTDTVNFIQSLHNRANSIVGINGISNESRVLANMLRHLANDVNDVMQTQAPALPAPAQNEQEQHWNRVEQGVNQPAGLGALDRNDSNMLRMQTTNWLNGDRDALNQLSPVQREMADILVRRREIEPTLLNELDHRRLINTLVSQTYSPVTDGEALITLADTRSGMFAGLDDAQRDQVKDIIEKWNFTRFPNYRPPEEGMGEDPRGHKRGGVIRKMNEGGEPPKLSPYEQFKIDNAERIRQGQDIIENRNKYDPYKGSDKPIPTQRGSAVRPSGSAGTLPSGSGPSFLDRPRLYSIGGKVYMEVGGGVKPVPNIPQTPAKTNPNTTDHVVRKPVDEGFRDVFERVRNTPKPSGSAGTMPSGSGASYLDRPHLYANGGRIRMNEGGLPEETYSAGSMYGEMGHAGIDPRVDPKVPSEYARTGLPEVTGDPADVWETKYQLNQASRNNLNFNDPAYTLGMKEVRVSTPMPDEWGGYHSDENPDVVHIKNIHRDPNYYSQVLTHEGQHLQDYKTNQNRMPIKSNLDAIESLYKSGQQYLNQRAIENNYQKYKDNWVAQNPDKMPYGDLGAYWNADAPWNERIADLASLEGNLKRGERFADTPMGREILNTPELQNYYYQSARPMEAKALPYEPTVFDRIRNASRNFNEKVGSGKSYVDSAYESAKEFKSGGDVNIDAMRLALMKG